ncbi:alpha/beta-hydrolase [Sistotremastrum suecicum HHB10207 ss-3]|uniref:Alpha/beta-hydrolase n=1 Tax=Sistotremastrum suecicum HHB10207 ss-3 TaxID=1314776 RepID=A0A166CJY6_9AGAM|nr:alpha/beta-hydrolase [Sistotremastrum suecicum HHB10207 ss-3]
MIWGLNGRENGVNSHTVVNGHAQPDKKEDSSGELTNTEEPKLLEKIHRPVYNEILSLAKSDRTVSKKDDYWLKLVWTYTRAYATFLYTTWSYTFISIFFGHLGPIDIFGAVFLATGASIVLWVLLVWCIVGHSLPFLLALKWYRRKSGGHRRSLVNILFDMFHLTHEQVLKGKEALSSPPPPKQSEQEDIPGWGHFPSPRTFDLDAAKMLLQLASLMYERTSEPTQVAILENRASSTFRETLRRTSTYPLFELSHPGGLLGAVRHDAEAEIAFQASKDKYQHNRGDAEIAKVTRRYHIQYAVASELNSVSSAFSALFWDAHSNWIVVAFKGTSPTEYDEWVSDFTYLLEEAGEYIRGFSKVHRGFLKRMFPTPSEDKSGRQPYDTIADAVRNVSKDLRKRLPPGTNINVWFTGHSLGCATASLAYSKAIVDEEGLDPQGRIIYAYFSVYKRSYKWVIKAFNERMSKHPDQPKTMWRITNRQDAVATLLPDFGDLRASILPNDSVFMFCHLGVEIKMRAYPQRCKVRLSGRPFDEETPVDITSRFGDKDFKAAAENGSGRFIGINWRGLDQENASGSTDSYERYEETSTVTSQPPGS